MSNITMAPAASGTATFTIAAPATNTNRTLTLPDTSGVLNAQGTAIQMATAVVSTSGSTATAIDFTGIPSWAKRITVTFSGVSTLGASYPILQIGTSSGIEASGYNGAVSTLTTGVTTATFLTSFLLMAVGAAGANTYHGSCQLNLVGSNTWVVAGNLGAPPSALSLLGGSKALSGVLDRVRITTSTADTFDAGTINIMWEG